MDELVRVLLVDDQESNLEALEAMLGATGCRLVRARSANEALLALLEHDFAAIVLDIRMPSMNGLELAQLIKARRRSRHVPILFLTAHLLDEPDVLRGYAVGAVDYLTKPLNPEILRAKVAVFVDLYRKSHALTTANDALQREIGEREKVEDELRQATQLLEERVQARTAEVLHAHEVLQTSEERLRLALDAGRMGTWEVDEASGVGTIDETECALLGLTPGTRVLPRDAFFAVVHPDDRESVGRTLGKARANDVAGLGTFEIEYRILRPSDGGLRWLLVRGRDVPESAGRPRRTVGVSFDITERKQSEQALKDADRRKNDFIATLAHELRNPLAPIRNAIHILMMRGPDDPDLAAARQVIARQTQHLTRLVDDLLDISRITRDKLDLRRETVELSKIVQAAVETSRPLIDAGRHELIVSLGAEPLLVHGDAMRLAQVIANLLNNAAKYSDPKGRITVGVNREGSDAVITVRDTGIGISSEWRPYVFDMFVQADRSRVSGGLGVGLALAKRLVEMHDGSIDVRSDGPGLGSEFVVRLPAQAAQSRDDAAGDGREDASLTSALRVLVVDDNRDAADSLARLLELVGNDVRIAGDGVQAVQAASDFQPDVVLLDIGLPKMNGYDAARAMRAQAGGRAMALIALTGWGQETDRHQSFEAGFDHHLVKPVEPVALLKLISSLGAYQVAGSSAAPSGARQDI